MKVLQNVINEYFGISQLRELIIDHGSHFGAHRIDEKGDWNSKFKELAENNGIKVILARVKHPQTNGKIEKWFDLYLKYRKEFSSVDEFVHWYNCIRPHESLEKKERLIRPESAFWSEEQPLLCRIFVFLFFRVFCCSERVGRNCQKEEFLDCFMKWLRGGKDGRS